MIPSRLCKMLKTLRFLNRNELIQIHFLGRLRSAYALTMFLCRRRDEDDDEKNPGKLCQLQRFKDVCKWNVKQIPKSPSSRSINEEFEFKGVQTLSNIISVQL
ncbi:hypothetical protein L596_016988 [Steinernema carpocapsae]|uniref:Uncharacterized protein n=1 Tax=Steinernema carpocapsae TaxID=34508 RepID=A0A4U5MZZ7_STECR|nr:hypothetical protein L596_016988 [Steinernema carpocapsae]